MIESCPLSRRNGECQPLKSTLTAYLCFYNECLLTHNQELPHEVVEKHIAGHAISRLTIYVVITMLIAVAVNVRCGSR